MLQANKLAVVNQIDLILQHLELYLPLANVHMVDYFTKDVFANYISKEIQKEAENYGYENTIQSIYNEKTSHLPHLDHFTNQSKSLTLKNCALCLSFTQFRDKLQQLGGNETSHLKLDVFMNAKKSHEVEVLSGVAAAIQRLSKTSHLIDIGDGKGYLSSMLALHYKLPILGIDASRTNTDGAIDRAKKLSKVWNGVVTNVKTRETSVDLYKQVTKFVDERLDFQELIENVFLEKSDKIGLVGLHTCGNLTPTCLKVFTSCPSIKTICNVGCCYHHLTEEFASNANNTNKSQLGFPLSQYLKEKKLVIGRGARMIAAQSVERILDKKERPSRTIFYRGLFEIIIEQVSQEHKVIKREVGRFRKGSPNFLDYVKKASKRIDMPLEISDDDIIKLYERYDHRIVEMDLFYLIRSMLAPVVESLIILDRLLFLFENNFEQSYVVQFFDPVVSPRCYGIVSIKN